MLIAALLAFQPAVLPALSPAAIPLETTATEGVGALIGGIISYSRWPTQPRPVRLCLVGSTRYALRMSDAQRIAGQSILIRSIGTTTSPASCDVVYLGTLRVAARTRLIAATHGQPIVSIIENDVHCRSGAMFCLVPSRSSFKINLDAVSRSQVHIDPRVLRIASGGEQG